ncbi:two-component system CheB/CheR fusion protein [Alkalispirillum mobile]|uniref:Two-component system CheB/CheR fusion protein n=1 Tax=Alkalispirillum mobile TaxID=85925 RepID=A0A498C2C8_9GAMM|nr:chemotaxis protein CheB [Alkalispirillum mobile]RLK48776.1 two-component system CheB/CheR fusion protein [Alkalispirillum mobile]
MSDEQTEHENRPEGGEAPRPLTVVGIGASAGGLDALRALVKALPADTGLTFVVAQHLSPRHESMLTQLLARETALAVRELSDGRQPVADTVYVAPASYDVQLEDGRFRLVEPGRRPGPSPSVDVLLQSLADAYGDRAVAVVLSGTGSDGSSGVRAVKAAGGITFAQDADSAAYDGMPLSALSTGCVDRVLPPTQIAAELVRMLAQENTGHPVADEQSDAEIWRQIQHVVYQASGVDPSAYKERTVRRRLARRMAARGVDETQEYLSLLRNDGKEVDAFYRDLLISVTSFFRDGPAFEALGSQLRQYLEKAPEGGTFRAWAPGCATGEEAYSIAMLVDEVLEKLDRKDITAQVFATDLDSLALTKARAGLYEPAVINELSEQRQRRYFTRSGDNYRVTKRLREMLVFARQDLLHDPPFLRMDLISCRNLLIYLTPQVQQRLFSVFAYALRPSGLLFLGKSENLDRDENLFHPLDYRWKIYRRRGGPRRARVPAGGTGGLGREGVYDEQNRQRVARRNNPPESAELRMLRVAAEAYAPPALLLDESLGIHHIFGDLGDYLRIPSGRPDFSVRNIIHNDLRVDITALVARAKRGEHAVSSRRIRIGEGRSPVRMTARPVPGEGDDPLYLVTFDPEAGHRPTATEASDGEPVTGGEEEEQRVAELEDELAATREHLQTVIEELETTNEELQSSNEELQSSNEELQSSNEELETTNEELQSTNEELTTVNDELNGKSQELAEAYADLESVKDSLADPLLAVDDKLRIKFYNPATDQVFAIRPEHVGQPISSVEPRLLIPDFEARLRDVLRTGELVEAQLSTQLTVTEEGGSNHEERRHFLMRIHPCRTEDGDYNGAVLTFFENTAIRRAEGRVRELSRRQQAILDRTPLFITLRDPAGRYLFANRTFLRLLGREADEVVGRTAEEVLPGEAVSLLDQHDWQTLRSGQAQEREESLALEAGEPARQFLVERFPLHREDGAMYAVCTMGLDVTERLRDAQWLRLQSLALDAIGSGVAIADATRQDLPLVYVNRAFEELSGYPEEEIIGRNCRFLQGSDADPEAVNRISAGLSAQERVSVLLRNCRRDGERFWNRLFLEPVHDEAGALTHYVGVQQDVTEQVEREQALRDSEERLLGAQVLARVAWFEIFPVTGVMDWGDTLWDLLGARPDAFKPSLPAFLRFVHPKDRPTVEAVLTAERGAGDELDLEYRVIRPDQQVAWLQTRGRLVGQGREKRLLGLTQETTQRRQAEDALDLARRQAEAANRAKTEFLSNMSHELRTPLNAILGFGQLLQDDQVLPPESAGRTYVDHILNSGWHLLELISEILDLSRIEAGRIGIETGAVSPRDLVNECLPVVANRADAEGIELAADVDAAPAIMADFTRAKQVLINLLSNAIKYNRPDGWVRVEARQLADDRVALDVKDSGPGLSEKAQESLFHPFDRLGQEHSSIEGTGIGLVVSLRLARLMGGDILVESTPGQGSTFTLVLPRADQARPLAAGRHRGETADQDRLPLLNEAEAGMPLVTCDSPAVSPSRRRAADDELQLLLVSENDEVRRRLRGLCLIHPELRLHEVATPEQGADWLQQEPAQLLLVDEYWLRAEPNHVLQHLRAVAADEELSALVLTEGTGEALALDEAGPVDGVVGWDVPLQQMLNLILRVSEAGRDAD